MNEPNAIIKQAVEQFWEMFPLSANFSIQIFYQDYPVLWATAIYISSCKAKCYCLSFVITEQVKFETMTPPCYQCL